jgi:hypothetical protein
MLSSFFPPRKALFFEAALRSIDNLSLFGEVLNGRNSAARQNIAGRAPVNRPPAAAISILNQRTFTSLSLHLFCRDKAMLRDTPLDRLQEYLPQQQDYHKHDCGDDPGKDQPPDVFNVFTHHLNPAIAGS